MAGSTELTAYKEHGLHQAADIHLTVSQSMIYWVLPTNPREALCNSHFLEEEIDAEKFNNLLRLTIPATGRPQIQTQTSGSRVSLLSMKVSWPWWRIHFQLFDREVISPQEDEEDTMPCCEKRDYRGTLMLRDCLDNKIRRCVSAAEISEKQIKVIFKKCNV